MSRTIPFRFDAITGTQAGLGHAGGRTLTADRPDGVAGGKGLGFNGGELLAAALGGCFWNDLHYSAERLGHPVSVAAVDVAITLDGAPPCVTAATITARLDAGGPTATKAVFDAAAADSTIANSIAGAVRIVFALGEERV
jgi:organic hydroperoxide reductase OsmC/OhrA